MAPTLLLAACGGLASAVLYMSVLAGGLGALILAYLAPLPLMALGLGLGLTPILLGGIAAAAGIAAIAGTFAALAYAVTNLLPALVVVRQALLARTGPDGDLEWYPPGLLMAWLTALGVAILALGALLSADGGDGLEGRVRAFLSSGLGPALGMAGTPPDAATQAFIDLVSSVFPAMVIASWLVMAIVNGALAQGLLMRFGRNRRPPMRMADLALPPATAAALAAAGVMAVATDGQLGYAALNAAVVLMVPFFFAGLSVVHAYAQGRKARGPILVGFYGLLLLLQWAIPLVVGLGLMEQWAGLRRRVARPRPDQEDK